MGHRQITRTRFIPCSSRIRYITSMIRAHPHTLARNLSAAVLLVAITAFSMTSTASARVSQKLFSPQTVTLNEKSPDAFVQLAQKRRIQKRRNKRRRGLNNRQSDSAVSSGRAASLGTVARSVRRRFPGQLLDARLMKDRRGKLTYRLKILGRNGVMRNVTADAYTGAILGVR